MKTQETKTRAQFQYDYERGRKTSILIYLSMIIIFGIVESLVVHYLYATYDATMFIMVGFTLFMLCFFGWVIKGMNFDSKSWIKFMEDEIKEWGERLEYLQDLQKLSLEEIHKIRRLIDEKMVLTEYKTVAEEITLCETNIKESKLKIVYLMSISSFWKYFFHWKWLKKIPQ